MSIFTEDVKNTRFFLTIIGVGALMVALISIIMIGALGITLNSGTQTILASIVGAIVTIVGTSYNSYFKDRQAVDMAKQNQR